MLLAMGLGGLIGIEREAADKPAGVRTHMLVAGAAALLVGLGTLTVQYYGTNAGDRVRADPIRIIQSIVIGVSVLGAGTILRGASGEVTGLTTAASLLMAAALGIAVAVSQWPLAVTVTALVLISLHALPGLKGRPGKHRS